MARIFTNRITAYTRVMQLAIVIALTGTALAAANLSNQGWTVWSPRPEIAPRGYVDAVHSHRGEGRSMVLSGDSNPAVFGGWQRELRVEPGKWYRLTAWYRAEGLDYAPRQVLARLDWMSASGHRTDQPDYATAVAAEGDWNRITLDAASPQGASAVRIELLLLNAPRATVWWDDISFEAIPAPPSRTVTVATLNFRPSAKSDPVGEFIAAISRTVPRNADIILLPEAITLVGTGKKYGDVAEPLPGPTTARLGEVARSRRAWIVAGVLERENATIYNTAVLIDREGRLAGKYRKVYLPREEVEGGITAGSDYPVFRTDFGTIGMMICWDVQYPDPARALALRGAEMILMPIWGGNTTLGAARAIENQIYLVSSGYDYPTEIVDPNGEVRARAAERGAVAVWTIDLNRRIRDEWLGDMRQRMWKEARFDVAVDPPGRK